MSSLDRQFDALKRNNLRKLGMLLEDGVSLLHCKSPKGSLDAPVSDAVDELNRCDHVVTKQLLRPHHPLCLALWLDIVSV